MYLSQDDIDLVVAKGRLISKRSDDPTVENLWLVEIDGGLQPNEDMDESRFGEILGKADEPMNAPSARNPLRSVKSSALSVTSIKESKDENNSTKELNGTTRVSDLDQSRSSSSRGNGKTSKSKKAGHNDYHASAPSSDASSSPADQNQKTSLAPATHEQHSERRLNHPLRDIPRPLKKQKVSKQKEDVVRIPMKTGVLLLYKGIHRRAEFVRKV